jgi:hypothetical protein
MVREGGDQDDPDRMATTVLLDAGGESTPTDDLDRAVEVAASVLAAAADQARARISGAYRLVTTTGLDTGAQRDRNGLHTALVSLAGVGPSPVPAAERFGAAVSRLGRPERDEVLVIVGAFEESPPDPLVLRVLAREYARVVVVLVGAERSPVNSLGGTLQVDLERAGSRGVLGTGRSRHGSAHDEGVLAVPLPRGAALAAAWSLELGDSNQDAGGPFTHRWEATAERAR